MYLEPRVTEITKRRMQLELSAYALAIKAGLDKKAIYRVESGDSRRTHHLRAQAIAKALGCRVEDIFIIPSRSSQKADSNK